MSRRWFALSQRQTLLIKNQSVPSDVNQRKNVWLLLLHFKGSIAIFPKSSTIQSLQDNLYSRRSPLYTLRKGDWIFRMWLQTKYQLKTNKLSTKNNAALEFLKRSHLSLMFDRLASSSKITFGTICWNIPKDWNDSKS